MEQQPPLIPNPTTEVDHRVNAAYRRALRRGKMQFLYAGEPEGDGLPPPLVITDTRPGDRVCVAVSPERWAMTIAPGAVAPWESNRAES